MINEYFPNMTEADSRELYSKHEGFMEIVDGLRGLLTEGQYKEVKELASKIIVLLGGLPKHNDLLFYLACAETCLVIARDLFEWKKYEGNR